MRMNANNMIHSITPVHILYVLSGLFMQQQNTTQDIRTDAKVNI